MINFYKFYGVTPIHGVDILPVLKSCFIKQYGYRALYSNSSGCRIKSALTTSNPVEELHKLLKSRAPASVLVTLESAVYDESDGWYKCVFIFQAGRSKSRVQYVTRVVNGILTFRRVIL